MLNFKIYITILILVLSSSLKITGQCSYGEDFTDNDLSEWPFNYNNLDKDWSGNTLRLYDPDVGFGNRHAAHTRFYQKVEVPTCDLQLQGRFKLSATNTNRDQKLSVKYILLNCNSTPIGYINYYTRYEGCSGSDGCSCSYCDWCDCPPHRQVTNWKSGTNNGLDIYLEAENNWQNYKADLDTILNNTLTGVDKCNIDSVKIFIKTGGAWDQGSDFYLDYIYLNCNTNTPCSGCTDCALPIELVTFEGKRTGQNIKLQWTTASEYKNAYFKVQRKKNPDQPYKALGKVKGAHQTITSTKYHFIDTTAAPGINYYRLKQVNFDSSYTYSSTITVRKPFTDQKIHIYPSPSHNKLYIKNMNAIASPRIFKLYDIQGQLIRQNKINIQGNRGIVNTASLPAGTYFLQLGSRSFHKVMLH